MTLADNFLLHLREEFFCNLVDTFGAYSWKSLKEYSSHW